MEIYAALFLLAGIIAMDTTSGPQILLSEPVVSCSILGILFGMPEFGLGMGILFQLLWLGYMPLGAVRLTDGNMASYISTAGLFAASRIFGIESEMLRAAVVPAMLYGLIVGAAGLYMTQLVRKLNAVRNDNIRARIEHGEDVSIAFGHFSGILSSFLRGVLMALVLVPAGAVLLGCIRFLPPRLAGGMTTASLLIWGTVTASAIIFFRLRERLRFIVLGSICGVIWILVL